MVRNLVNHLRKDAARNLTQHLENDRWHQRGDRQVLQCAHYLAALCLVQCAVQLAGMVQYCDTRQPLLRRADQGPENDCRRPVVHFPQRCGADAARSNGHRYLPIGNLTRRLAPEGKQLVQHIHNVDRRAQAAGLHGSDVQWAGRSRLFRNALAWTCTDRASRAQCPSGITSARGTPAAVPPKDPCHGNHGTARSTLRCCRVKALCRGTSGRFRW